MEVIERDGVLEVVRGDHVLSANLGATPVPCSGDVVLSSRLSDGELAPDGCAIVRR
jgi:hypothetical protein